MRCLVAGAGGFIGGHLVKRLLDDGHEVISADIKSQPIWWQKHTQSPYYDSCDLRTNLGCYRVFQHNKIDWVFNLACNMGGIGFIEQNKADCMESVLINTNLLRLSKSFNVKRYFFASSACVYHADRQNGVTAGSPLAESDAYYNGGAMPEDGYGWEKLFSERMCRHAREDWGIDTRIARFHNIYGPHGSWNDGREKAPAALCRKVAIAKKHNSGTISQGTIEIWGDGTQRRSYCYIDDCVEGIMRLMQSNYTEPINIGSSELVSVDRLSDRVQKAAGYPVAHTYDTTKPKGVDGRNSDNTLILEVLGWQPLTRLTGGIAMTYPQIEKEVFEDASL